MYVYKAPSPLPTSIPIYNIDPTMTTSVRPVKKYQLPVTAPISNTVEAKKQPTSPQLDDYNAALEKTLAMLMRTMGAQAVRLFHPVRVLQDADLSPHTGSVINIPYCAHVRSGQRIGVGNRGAGTNDCGTIQGEKPTFRCDVSAAVCAVCCVFLLCVRDQRRGGVFLRLGFRCVYCWVCHVL